jgi:hypothetical protein
MTAPSGWNNRSAYPLLMSSKAEMAITKLRADRGWSRGKAINHALEEGLISLGYLPKPLSKEEEAQIRKQKELNEILRSWGEMSEKARTYYLRKYPELDNDPRAQVPALAVEEFENESPS